MAGYRHLLILLLFLFGFVASKLPQELSTNVKNCENSCLKLFTSEKSSTVGKLSDACQRGCRFFLLVNSVASLSSNRESGENPQNINFEKVQTPKRKPKILSVETELEISAMFVPLNDLKPRELSNEVPSDKNSEAGNLPTITFLSFDDNNDVGKPADKSDSNEVPNKSEPVKGDTAPLSTDDTNGYVDQSASDATKLQEKVTVPNLMSNKPLQPVMNSNKRDNGFIDQTSKAKEQVITMENKKLSEIMSETPSPPAKNSKQRVVPFNGFVDQASKELVIAEESKEKTPDVLSVTSLPSVKNSKQRVVPVNGYISPDHLLKSSHEPQASARTNNSKEACQASCMEAYRHTGERYACHEGCTHMARETAREEERIRQAALEESARELASLAAVGPLLSSMFSQLYAAVGPQKFTVFVSTSDDSDGPHSEDVYLLEQPQDQTIFMHASDSEPDDVLTDPALMRQLEASSSLDIALRLPEQRVRTFPAMEHAARFPPAHPPNQAHAAPADLLACLSTRYGVPKWLLGFLALITGILTAWLCLEPWDRAAILEENAGEKSLLVETEDDEIDEKLPLPDMVKIPLDQKV